uniref:Uncharacterized protein n=1 Tax=Kalanchoe fedtschenkoi TaxID=63787 RepID=A0A7N0TAM1_KALFE
MTSSPPADDLPLVETSEVDSRLASVVYDLSSQVQAAMEGMLNKISEIDQNAVGVMEEIEKSKASALERKKALEEEKERVEKAAYTVLDLFSRRDTI